MKDFSYNYVSKLISNIFVGYISDLLADVSDILHADTATVLRSVVSGQLWLVLLQPGEGGGTAVHGEVGHGHPGHHADGDQVQEL